ncbi:MAG: hypothetical protein RJA70_3041 [Pseudomonadota bacterium]
MTAVLSGGQLVMGERVRDFERAFASFQGSTHGIATSSGTTALTAALLAHGVGPGDEVILPAFTFFATASAVLAVGARPRFADIDPESYTLSAQAIAQALTPRTRAVIVVHLYGQLADMKPIAELCNSRRLILIEDAAQAHGAEFRCSAATEPSVSDGEPSSAQFAGAWGTACFSFHPSKNLTTTEGGMVLTRDTEFAARLRQVRNQGRDSSGLHGSVGFNFRMSEVCAAIGVEQLKKLPKWLSQRRQNARYYDERLAAVGRPWTRPGNTPAFQLYTIRSAKRDTLLLELRRAGVDARVYYSPGLHRQPALHEFGRDAELPETDRAAAQVLSLPVHPGVSPEGLSEICELVERYG